MNKLFGLLLCGCVAAVLSLGAVGCNPENKDKDKNKAAKGDDKAKAEVKIKAIADQKLKKKAADQKITVEIDADAPVDLTISAKGTKVTGTGKIEKGKKSGDVMIATDDAGEGEVTVTIAGTEKTKEATATFKAKME